MIESVLLVIREGVYMRGIWGVYKNREEAEFALDRAKAYEDDDYHVLSIERAEIGVDSKIGYL